MRLCLLVCLGLRLLAAAGSAYAEHPPGSFGSFFDLDGTEPCRSDIVPGIAFNAYFAAFGLPGDLFGFEFRVENPEGLFVLDRHPIGYMGVDLPTWDDNWIWGTGVCIEASGSVALVSEHLLAFAPVHDLLFCVTDLPTGMGTTALGGRAGWLACDETWHPFSIIESVPDLPGCAIGNDTQGRCFTVSAGETSWGAIKGQFRR